MRKTNLVVALLLALVLAAGLASAQVKKRPGMPLTPEERLSRPRSETITSAEYTPILLGDSFFVPGGPWGLGVMPSGSTFINLTFVPACTMYEARSGGFLWIDTGGRSLTAGRYWNGYFAGANPANIYKFVNDDWKLLATVGGGGQITGLDVDHSNGDLYFAQELSSSSEIWRLPRGGHNPIHIASVPFESWGLAVKGNMLYVSDYYGDAIYKLLKKGGSAKLYIAHPGGPTDLIFDNGGNLYIAEYASGRIDAVKAGTTTVHTIASGFNTPFYIGVDAAGNVYFSDFNDSSFWKLKRIFN